MNAYFFKMNKAERNEILDQHRKVYDGFVTDYGQQINQQPLYVQDYANDKGGITVNNKGEVKTYTNMRINEMRHDGMDTGLFSSEVDEYITPSKEFTHQDEIGDNSEHFEHGTYDNTDDIEYELVINDKEPNIDVYTLDIEDEENIEQLQEQLNKTLDMFKRFKKY